MPDIALSWATAANHADWVQSGSVLMTGNDLESAIIISLFSDRLAAPGDVIPDRTKDPRGWWADTEVPIGSRLWLLNRSKQIPSTLQKAYDYIAEALQWLLDDRVVAKFDINVQWVQTSFLGAQITAYKQDGTTLMTGLYTWAWSGINV